MRLFGGTQAYRWTFHECPKQLYLWYQRAEAARPSLFDRLRFERGNELEARFLKTAQDAADSYVDIRESRWRDRVAATRAAMRDGVGLILHPFLEGEHIDGLEELGIRIGGEADALRRVSASGSPRYETVEVKQAGSVLPHHRSQLALYLLAQASRVDSAPETGVIVTWERSPDGEIIPVEHRLTVTAEQQDLLHFFHEDVPRIVNDRNADFHLQSKCDQCPFRDRCEGDAVREQHLSVLPRIRRRQRADLLVAGVRKWPDLAVDPAAFEIIEKRWPGTGYSLRGLRAQALAFHYDCAFPMGGLDEGIADNPAWKLATGDGSVSGARVYFDLETDALENNAVYLFGYQVEFSRCLARSCTQGMSEAKVFEATLEAFCAERGYLHPPIQHVGTTHDERRLFEEFLDSMDALRAECKTLSIIHYANFETKQLRQLAQRHPDVRNVEERVERIIGECVDVYSALTRTRTLPVMSFSLKHVAPALLRISAGKHGRDWSGPRTRSTLREFLLQRGFTMREAADALASAGRAAEEWDVPVDDLLAPNAGNSVVWFRQLIADVENPLWPLLITAYNADDLLALREVTHWLAEELRPKASEHPSDAPSVGAEGP